MCSCYYFCTPASSPPPHFVPSKESEPRAGAPIPPCHSLLSSYKLFGQQLCPCMYNARHNGSLLQVEPLFATMIQITFIYQSPVRASHVACQYANFATTSCLFISFPHTSFPQKPPLVLTFCASSCSFPQTLFPWTFPSPYAPSAFHAISCPSVFTCPNFITLCLYLSSNSPHLACCLVI